MLMLFPGIIFLKKLFLKKNQQVTKKRPKLPSGQRVNFQLANYSEKEVSPKSAEANEIVHVNRLL